MQDVDLTSHSLFIALVQDFMEYEEAPGSEGETEFHWLFRDRVDTPPSLSSLTAGQSVDFPVSLERGDWDTETLHVIAFAQHDANYAITQAGSNTTTSLAPASLFTNSLTTTRPTPREDRP